MKKLLSGLICLLGVISPMFAQTITQDGTIIENQTLTGQVTIKANNCIIRNCKIDVGDGLTGSIYGVHARNWDSNGKPYTGNVVENCEIQGSTSAGIYAHYTLIRRNNIHDTGTDAIKARSGCLIEQNWCHHLGIKPAAHADCVQIRSGNNIEIRRNWFEIPISQTGGSNGYKSNAAVIIGPSYGDVYNVNIHHNIMEGGNFTAYLSDGKPGTGYYLYDVKFHNNLIGPDFRYGPLTGSDERGYGWRGRRISIDRNYWFDGTFMAINLWDNDNK